jgi:two-component system LytT family response regulator
VDEIFCIEAAENYVKLQTEKEAHLHRETMKSIEARLPADRFMRISRTCIVNTDRVKEVQPFFNDTFIVILTNGVRLTASRTYRDKVKRLLGE